MLNKWCGAGRMTKTPELRKTTNGKSVCSFTIACDRDVKNADGAKETDFFDIVAWNATAEYIAKYGDKGRLVMVAGRVQFRDWKDKDGNNRRSAEVMAESIYFGDKNERVSDKSDIEAVQAKFDELSEDDGELPF